MNQSEHILTCVAEECGEVAQIALRAAQAATKALRFGVDDGYPETDRTNRNDLVSEVNDLLGALEALQDLGVDLPGLYSRAAIEAKKTKITKWMDHAARQGTLQHDNAICDSTSKRTDFTEQKEKTIYMFGWGEHYERRSAGPFFGNSSINIDSLIHDYQRHTYNTANMLKEDECSLDEDGFTSWLVASGILTATNAKHVELSVSDRYFDAYVPDHWPKCPQCSVGRGKQEYGSVRQSLNRITVFHRCSNCDHEWNFSEIANNASLPMLEDDGRDTVGGCVPFSLSKACGLKFDAVLTVCKKYGWNATNGMFSNQAVLAARELGFELKKLDQFATNGRFAPTLKLVLTGLYDERNYVIGVKNHWLAVVNGWVVDNDTATGFAKRVTEIYEVRRIEHRTEGSN